MTISELRNRSALEARLAALLLLRAVEQSGQQGKRLGELAQEMRAVRNDFPQKRIAIRFGYRNSLGQFVRCLFAKDLLDLEAASTEDDVICRITEAGKSELSGNPPEQILALLGG